MRDTFLNEKKEFNKIPDEINRIDILNDYNKRSEINSIESFNKESKSKNRGIVRAISRIMVAILIFTFAGVPVLGLNLSNNMQSETIPDIEPEPNPEPDTIPLINPSYKVEFSNVTYKNIKYSVYIEGVDDFTNNEYSIIVLEYGNDNDNYIKEIPSNLMTLHKKVITSSNVNGEFNTYLSKEKISKIKKDTNYMLVLLKDNSIIISESFKTNDFIYISNIEVKKNSEYIMFIPSVNPEFSNYNIIRYEFYDSNTSLFITASMTSLGSLPSIMATEFAAANSVDIKAYYNPLIDDLDEEYKIIDELKYYFIYETNNIDIAPYK